MLRRYGVKNGIAADFAWVPYSIDATVRGFRTIRGAWHGNVRSILHSHELQIVRRNDLPFPVLHFHCKGFSGAFIQNPKTFLAAGEEITFSPLAQSNDDREQLSAFLS